MLGGKRMFHLIINAVCLLVLIGTAVFLFLYWPNIPDLVPGHYNSQGEIDRWTNKNELLIIPIMSWLLFIMVSVAEHFPQTWNTGIRVTKENAIYVYQIMRQMLALTKLWMVLMFGYLTIQSTLSLALSRLFLPVSLLTIFGTIIFHSWKLLMIKKKTLY